MTSGTDETASRCYIVDIVNLFMSSQTNADEIWLGVNPDCLMLIDTKIRPIYCETSHGRRAPIKNRWLRKITGNMLLDHVQSTEFRENIGAGISVARRFSILSLYTGFRTAGKEIEGFLLPFK